MARCHAQHGYVGDKRAFNEWSKALLANEPNSRKTFRCSFDRSLFLDLDSYSGSDSDGMFSLFYKPVAWKLAPNLAVIFGQLVKGSSFSAC